MTQKLSLLILMCLSIAATAQTNEELELGADTVFTIVDSMPIFPGCEAEAGLEAINSCTDNKIYRHIAQETRYPENALNNGISGTIYMRFILNEYGDVSNIEVLRGVSKGKDLEKESVRVISTIPKMRPAIHEGKVVRVQYTIPIRFNLTGGRKKKKKR